MCTGHSSDSQTNLQQLSSSSSLSPLASPSPSPSQPQQLPPAFVALRQQHFYRHLQQQQQPQVQLVVTADDTAPPAAAHNHNADGRNTANTILHDRHFTPPSPSFPGLVYANYASSSPQLMTHNNDSTIIMRRCEAPTEKDEKCQRQQRRRRKNNNTAIIEVDEDKMLMETDWASTASVFAAGADVDVEEEVRTKSHQYIQNESLETTTGAKSDANESTVVPFTPPKLETPAEKTTPAHQTNGPATILLVKGCDIQSHDVLCGRDKATFNFVGNRRFRASIGTFIPAYAAARTKRDKAAVIVAAVRKIRNEDGSRFLKKYDVRNRGGDTPNDDLYIELDEVQARKKTGHALRDIYVARSQKEAKHAARASDGGTAGTKTMIMITMTTKKTSKSVVEKVDPTSIERNQSARSRSESILEDDKDTDDISGCGLDDDRRQSDISVVHDTPRQSVATEEAAEMKRKKKARRRTKRQPQRQEPGLIDNAFSEESFSDSLSSMLPFVEDGSNQHGDVESMEPLPAFSRPSSQHNLSQEPFVSIIDHTRDHQSAEVQLANPLPPPPLTFPQPFFPGPLPFVAALYPYPFNHPMTTTHIHEQHPQMYVSASFPQPSMHASPRYPPTQTHNHHQQQQQQSEQREQQPREGGEGHPHSQQHMDPVECQQQQQQQQYFNMYHHYHHHYFGHHQGGEG